MRQTALYRRAFGDELHITMNKTPDYVQWNLPEGAKARLGKGFVSDIVFSPGRRDHGGGKQRRRLAL